MRFLLLSDTHGKLGIINSLAARVHADAVIHAGDFGFYDDESYERLSDRELGLQIMHSGLPQGEKTRLIRLTRAERVRAVRAARLLGEFQSFVDGTASFSIPTYAVWGNHEDRAVVEQVVRGQTKVANLHILDGKQTFKVGSVLLYGLGGNLLPGTKMMQSPLAGGGGRIWTTLRQCADLLGAIDQEGEWPGLRLFVSHVSPGKEPFIELLGARTRADLTVSGHMGPPACMVWNPFAIADVEEAKGRLQRGLEAVKQACLAASQDALQTEEAFALIGRVSDEAVRMGRGQMAPRWYRAMTHVNLPDAHVGYAVMEVENGRHKIRTAII